VFTSEYVIDEAIITALARTRRHDFLANTTAAIKHLIFMKNSSTQSSILIKNASRTLLLASSSTAYLGDILNYRLAKVRVEEHPPSYFGVTPNFINALKGQFQNSITIMMECHGLKTQSMAEAFTQKGAKAYILKM